MINDMNKENVIQIEMSYIFFYLYFFLHLTVTLWPFSSLQYYNRYLIKQVYI